MQNSKLVTMWKYKCAMSNVLGSKIKYNKNEVSISCVMDQKILYKKIDMLF